MSHEPRERSHHAYPQENDTRDRATILAVPQRAPTVLDEQPSRGPRICARNVGGLGGNDVRVGEGGGERKHAGEDGADAPGELDGGRLAAFGPEEIEEEGGAEDGGDVDADEDVVRGDADEVVVVDGGAGGLDGDEILLVDVVLGVLESGLLTWM